MKIFLLNFSHCVDSDNLLEKEREEKKVLLKML